MSVLPHMKRCHLIMRSGCAVAACLLLLGVGGIAAPVWSDGAVHQQLTFLAAKQLSRCDQTRNYNRLR